MSGMLKSVGEDLDWKELMKLVYGERGQEGWREGGRRSAAILDTADFQGNSNFSRENVI